MLFNITTHYYFITFTYGICLIYKVKLTFKLKIGNVIFLRNMSVPTQYSYGIFSKKKIV